jgi:hypothetical protein
LRVARYATKRGYSGWNVALGRLCHT